MFCESQICQKCVGGGGSAPDPAGGAHAHPNPLVCWGLHNPHPLRAFEASILAPLALSFCAPQCKILAMPLNHFTAYVVSKQGYIEMSVLQNDPEDMYNKLTATHIDILLAERP